MFEVLFSLFLYSKYVNFIPPKLEDEHRNYVQINKSIVKRIEEKVLKLDTQKLWRQYENWKKLNTGTYVYLCKAHGHIDELIFVYANHIVKSMNIANIEKKNIFTLKKVEEISKSKDRLLRRKRFRYIVSGLHEYLLQGKYDLLSGLSSVYKNFNFFLEYDKKFHYLSAVNVTHGENIVYPTDISPIIIYSYGLLMLPKETKYTDKVVEKILSKYEQAWECEKKLLTSKKIKSEQNLTMLEKAVGKEKLECLDKYLIWDENEQK